MAIKEAWTCDFCDEEFSSAHDTAICGHCHDRDIYRAKEKGRQEGYEEGYAAGRRDLKMAQENEA